MSGVKQQDNAQQRVISSDCCFFWNGCFFWHDYQQPYGNTRVKKYPPWSQWGNEPHTEKKLSSLIYELQKSELLAGDSAIMTGGDNSVLVLKVSESASLELGGSWDPKKLLPFENFPLYQLPFPATTFSHVLWCSAESRERISCWRKMKYSAEKMPFSKPVLLQI